MEIRLLDDRANPLLKRHEVQFEVTHATRATPSRDEVRSELSKLVHAPKDRVVVERMAARYGAAVTRGEALVYQTVDAVRSTERTHILIRNGLKEKVAEGVAPAAEPTKQGPPKVETPAAPPAPKEAAKGEPHKGESHKGEPHKAEPHKGESHKGEPHKAEPHKGEPHKGKVPKDEESKGGATPAESSASEKKV